MTGNAFKEYPVSRSKMKSILLIVLVIKKNMDIQAIMPLGKKMIVKIQKAMPLSAHIGQNMAIVVRALDS